ncbi:hypothetical protein CVU75_03780 [Candidatus Dependentiae bacterium HGW-Dependentiae-1]|nr:MAG: hypothetical protein CVU75_03780 [Candidatus Dependentiae bacterium HGW-Dependentiae-1]
MKSSNTPYYISSRKLLYALCALSINSLRAPITIIESTTQLEKELASNAYTVVEFYADWCHVCHSIQKPFELVANNGEFQKKVLFAQVDIDKHKNLKTKYGVLGVPTFVYFENGKKKQQDMGVHNMANFKEELRMAIKKHFKLAHNTPTIK